MGSLLGIAETQSSGQITISNSYATGVVNGNSPRQGGLVGQLYLGITTSNSYAIGRVNSSQFDTGGLIGRNYASTVTTSYYDRETTGKSDSGKGLARFTNEMKQHSNYSGWDFTNVWGIDENLNNGYPYLRWQYE